MFLEVASQLVGLGSWADWSSRMGRLFYLVAWVVPCIQLNVIQHGQKKKKRGVTAISVKFHLWSTCVMGLNCKIKRSIRT